LELIEKNEFKLNTLGTYIVKNSDQNELFKPAYSNDIIKIFTTILLQKKEVIYGLKLSKNEIRKNELFKLLKKEVGYYPSMFQFAVNSEIFPFIKVKKTFNMITKIHNKFD